MNKPVLKLELLLKTVMGRCSNTTRKFLPANLHDLGYLPRVSKERFKHISFFLFKQEKV